MAGKLPVSLFSSCIVCRTSFQPANLTSRTQVAYKWAKQNQNRKNSKLDFATIELLQDIPKYGPQGAILQVTRGQMRNTFYPRRQARYIVGDELKELKKTGMKFERDHSFGVEAVVDAETEQQAELDAFKEDMGQRLAEMFAQRQEILGKQKEDQERAKELSLHAIARLPEVIQPIYVFHRKVNIRATEGSSVEPFKAGTPIFGSVSASDVAQEIRKSLAADADTATLPIDETSITFPSLNIKSVTLSATPSPQKRLKELGIFQIDIQIPGSDPIRTSIEIRPDEAIAEDEVAASSFIKKVITPEKGPES